MARRTGYLSSFLNIPPLIFRFQFNPEILSDKKSYKYDAAPSFGLWRFDQTQASSGFFGTIGGLANDVMEIGALLVNTRSFDPKEGEARTVTLEFKLDASTPGPLDGGSHGSILPDIALLRSFLYPSYSAIDIIKMIASRDVGCFNKPPEVSLKYGHVSMTGVMTDLDIRVTDFYEDGEPMRAEIRTTIKEQTFSFYPITDTVSRIIDVAKSYGRPGFGLDVLDSQLPTFIADKIDIVANR